MWDYSTGRIPNFLQFNLMSIGLIYSFCLDGWRAVLLYLAKVAIVGLVLFPLFVLSMIGGGDVKIIALSAGYFPFNRILWFVFYLMLCASVMAIIKLLTNRNLRERVLYFCKYVRKAVLTKEIKPYHDTRATQIRASIVMSGPILFSVFLALGGVY